MSATVAILAILVSVLIIAGSVIYLVRALLILLLFFAPAFDLFYIISTKRKILLISL